MGTGSSPGVKWQRRGVDHPPHLTPRLKKSRVIPLLPLRVYVACSRVNFTFTVRIFPGGKAGVEWR